MITEPSNIYISETFVNATRGHQLGESPIYKTWTDARGELFQALQKEYGRCVSAVYIDKAGGRRVAVGWVFQKRMEYENARRGDNDRFYIREVWVTLHSAPDTTTRTRHYIEKLPKE